MKTLEQYVTLVQQDVDDTSTGAKAIIQQEVIATYAEVMRQVGQFLQSSITEDDYTVVNQTTYPVTMDASVIHQVAYKPNNAANFKILGQISLEDYKDVFINRPASIPTNWFLDGDVINIAPKPNEVGIVRRVYTPNITDLETGATSLLPDRYTRTIITGAIARFKAWENNLSASQYYQGLYQQALHDCFLDLSNRAHVLSPKLYGRRY